MATQRKARPPRREDEIVSDEYADSATVPEPAGATRAEYGPFILQQLVEIHKTLGGLQQAQQTTIERLTKVEEKASGASGKLERLFYGLGGAGIVITLIFGAMRFLPINFSIESDPPSARNAAALQQQKESGE